MVLVAALLTGCDHPPTPSAPAPGGPVEVPVGVSVHVVHSGNADRSFRLYRPASLAPGTVAPLVIMLHGGGGSAEGAENRYGWDAAADRGRFLVAYPQGLARSWNSGGGCCGRPARANVDDTRFVTDVVATVSASWPLDGHRIDVTGMSAGGILAYQLACTTSVFAAVAPVSATQLGGCSSPPPASLIDIQGAADARVPRDGSPGHGVEHITGGRPIEAVAAQWRALDRCPSPTETTAGPAHTTTATCPDGRAVTLIVIDGAGHQWPGSRSDPERVASGSEDAPSTALDATTTIAAFFAAHPGP